MNSFMMLSSSAFGLPAVQAKPAENTSDGGGVSNNGVKKVKVSSIPLYPEPVSRKYPAKAPSKLEELVRRTRAQATNFKAEYQPIIDKIIYVADTGKAHTNQALWHVRNDTTTRVGVMALGGMLTGLIAAKRRGFYNKMSSLLIGLGGTGMLCYPEQTRTLASDATKLALKNARVAYHFIIGARPAVPNENGKPFDRLVGMTTDIGKWGFSLFEKMNPSNVEHEVTNARSEYSGTSDSDNEVLTSTKPIVKENASEEDIIAKSTTPSTKAHEEANILANELSFPAEFHPISEKENESAEPDSSSSPTSRLNIPSEDALIIEDENRTSGGRNSNEVLKPENGEEPAPTAAVAYEGDFGQGTLEDRELYTTRQ